MVDTIARSAVYEGIRAAIIKGEYGRTERLVESDLCERFSASRFEVRSALQELVSVGLVEFQRNRGARVRAISLHEAIEITEVRRTLEGFVAGRAAERITRQQIPALRRIAKDMRTAVKNTELVRYGQLNAELHEMIRDLSGHHTSVRMLSQLRDLTVRHQVSLSLVPGRPSVSLPQHEAIIEAVVAKDPVAACTAMQRHLDSVIDAYAALLEDAEPTN